VIREKAKLPVVSRSPLRGTHSTTGYWLRSLWDDPLNLMTANRLGLGVLPALFTAATTFVSTLTTIITLPLFSTTTAATTVATTATATTSSATTSSATTATAASAAATIATASAATTTEASGAFFTRAGFIDREKSTAKIFAIQASDRGLHGIGCVHADEGKSTRAAAIAIHRQENIGDASELAEKVGNILGGGFEGQVAHIHLGIHN
jgi:hypothetical protein